MQDATKILRQEHEVILRILDVTEKNAQALEAGAQVPAEVLSNTIEFLRLYADRQHHGKEEDLLFPEVEKKGMPREGGPIGMMLIEHKFGRGRIARMAEAAESYKSGNREAGAQWADAALDYVALLREHIAKENNILFVMAERMLLPADQQRLAAEFDGVDKNKMGEGEGGRLLRLADSLVAGVSAPAKS